MSDKDKWSAHLEYLKVAITLSSAILAVAASIYSDPSKLPVGTPKYLLMVSAIFVFATLVTSVWSVIHLCNYLIRSNHNAQDTGRAAKITRTAGASFFCLISAGLFILLFFVAQTFSGGTVVPALQATSTVSSIIKGQINNLTESLVFDGFEQKGAHYLLDYSTTPSAIKFQASVLAATGQVEWIKRQP